MPLVRYEVRCEHSLANPELFRSASRDDPEGLLEGVAMAGLVGIIRQLGDLAEFAAEVFRDLHNELVTVGGRTHDLTVRVQSLEAELPAVERALLSEPNQLRFAYTNGADWHVSIRSDQNHCTSGELPRFIRSFYEECRGPPRLFLLDKFDVAGAGACLKRYTDPSFFKVEWASSELMKAQRAQRERKARRDKKKGRRRKTGQPIAAVTQIPARVRYGSASLEDLDTFSHLLASTLKDEVPSSHSVPGASHGHGSQAQAQAQRRSNLGPKNRVAGGQLPPTGVLSPQAEGVSSTPLKISAKDIEANVSRKFYHPIEPGSAAESQGGKISKIIEMDNRDPVPSIGLIPRSGDIKSPKGASELKVSASDVEAKETNRVGREDLEVGAIPLAENDLQEISRGDASVEGLQGSDFGIASKINTADMPSREDAAVDDKDGVNIVDLRTSSGSAVVGTGFPGSQANSLTSSGGPSISGVDLANAQVSSTSGGISGAGSTAEELGSLARGSDPVHGLDDQLRYRSTEPPAGVRAPSTAAGEVEGLPASGDPAFHDDHLSKIKRVPTNVVDSSEASRNAEETVYKQPYLPPIRIEEIFDDEGSRMISAASPTPSSQCSSPREDIQPSNSMLSRLSYSSELVSVASDSELASPVSSKSPAFNALYSPSRSPRISGDITKSPPGIYSRPARRSDRGSPRSGTPVLSLSPESPSASVWTDGEDHAGPSRPPPPPTPVTVLEACSHFDSDQETNSVEPRFYPSPSPHANLKSGSEPDSVPLQPNEGSGYISNLRENVGNLHAESESSSLGNLELKHKPYSSVDLGTSSEPASAHMGSEVPCRSTPLTSLTSGLGSGTGLDEADPSSELRQGSASNPAFANFVRSSLILPPRPSESPSSSVHTSPLGTPKHRSQCIFVTNPSVKFAPSPLGQVASYDSLSLPVKDEESVPSSPTGSVIIKDTPSPPGSPASNYSESESEIHEFQSHNRPKSPVSPRSVAHALEDVIDERARSDIGVPEDPRFTSSQSGQPIAGSVQEGGLVKSASENIDDHAGSPPEGRVDALLTRTSPHHGVAHEASLQASPSISMQLDSGRTSPFDGMDAADLRPISTARLSPKSRSSSASNSPPDSPPLRKYLAGEDEDSAFQWARRSQPDSPSKMETGVSPASEASNSPPTSPPKFLDRASSLKWRGRSESASLNPDFSLPPNLVCRSEISSPSSSPPPQSDMESPKEWDEGSVFSDSSDSSEETTVEVAVSKVYRLPDSPLPPDSPTMSEEDDHSSGPPSKPEFDEDEDTTADHEHELVRTTATSASQHPYDSPSSALSKGSDEVLSGEPKVSDDGSQIRDAQLEPSTFGSSTPSFLPVTLSRLDTNQQPMKINSTTQAHESPPSPAAPEPTINPTNDAMATAAHHNWNMIKAWTFQDPGHSKLLQSDERFIIQDQTTKSFDLRRTESIEKKVPIIRPSANINVAAILEKANAIRQAFVGSDGEDDDEDDWSDS